MLRIIVDGYNVAAYLKGGLPADLEEARAELLDLLSSYARVRGALITVVFDAAYSTGKGSVTSSFRGIKVVFTRRGELADSRIAAMVRSGGSGFTVVTGDRSVADAVERFGAVAVSPAEFLERVEFALYAAGKGIDAEDEDCEWYSERRRGTRKKGPSRRLSKRERRRKKRKDVL